MHSTYSPRLSDRQASRSLRRAYAARRSSHSSASVALAFALLIPALILAACFSVYVAACGSDLSDPHNYTGTRYASCAAFGRLSSHYHGGRCD